MGYFIGILFLIGFITAVVVPAVAIILGTIISLFDKK